MYQQKERAGTAVLELTALFITLVRSRSFRDRRPRRNQDHVSETSPIRIRDKLLAWPWIRIWFASLRKRTYTIYSGTVMRVCKRTQGTTHKVAVLRQTVKIPCSIA